jgi:hypothetical protein
MAVTLCRQVGKGAKLGATRRSVLGAGADRPISMVPTSYGIRSPTAPAPGNPLATTSMRQAMRRRVSRRISRLSTQTFPSESDLDERTVHNIFETLNTFLRIGISLSWPPPT